MVAYYLAVMDAAADKYLPGHGGFSTSCTTATSSTPCAPTRGWWTERSRRSCGWPPSSLGGLPRYAHADIDIAGVHIRAGDAVLLSSSTANRDPGVYTDPERFDATRGTTTHLAFGYGPRYCIGASLARVELKAVFAALPRRLPGLHLAVPVQELRLRTDVFTGGLEALPVAW